jgi:ABC-type Fe3+/spermidine/putrescine transport system ATPase subunit
MLKINNLNITFNNFQLNNISLNISKGSYFVLLGNSGAGKSLLLKAISGFEKICSGEIILNNTDITHHEIHKRKIGYLMQDYLIFPHLSVFDNIAYSLKIKNSDKNKIKNSVEKWAAEFDISDLLGRSIKGLSGGEKQRIALARTMVSEPELILLDEPLSSIDVQLKDQIRALLRKINRMGVTVFHVTHDLNEAVCLADKIGVLNEGSLIFTGTTEELFNNPKHPFIARFIGIKNYFKATLNRNIDNDICKVILSSGKEISIATESPNGKGFFLLPSDEIILSLEKVDSSASNCFNGKIVDIIPLIRGVDIVVDCGEKYHVSITNKSKEKLNLHIGQNVYISWKALSGKFISE